MPCSFRDHLLQSHTREQWLTTRGEHPFLQSVADGTVTAQGMERWLVQDHLYASMGYIRLIGHMLLRVPLPIGIQQGQEEEKRAADQSRGILADALSNIHREIAFFEKTAFEAGFSLVYPKRPAAEQGGSDVLLHPFLPVTKSYIDFMAHIGSCGSWEEQLVLLWAMEKLYYEAWSWVARSRDDSQPSLLTPSATTALKALIDNWTNPGFQSFVDSIGDLLDHYVKMDKISWTELEKLEAVWKQVLWLEARFWDAGVVPF